MPAAATVRSKWSGSASFASSHGFEHRSQRGKRRSEETDADRSRLYQRAQGGRLPKQAVEGNEGLPERSRSQCFPCAEHASLRTQTHRRCRLPRHGKPLRYRRVRGDAGAGDVQRRKLDHLARELPRRKRECERRDLGAPGVNLKPVEVVAQYGANRLFER